VLGEYLCHPISELFQLPIHQFRQAGLAGRLERSGFSHIAILHIPGSIFTTSRIPVSFCFAFTSQRDSVIPGHIGAICTTQPGPSRSSKGTIARTNVTAADIVQAICWLHCALQSNWWMRESTFARSFHGGPVWELNHIGVEVQGGLFKIWNLIWL